MSTEALRKQFEQWYVENAFDVVREPIGSRDCGLQWKAWLAALAAAPAGGAEPVAWMYTLWFGDEAVQQVAFCYRFDLAVASPFGREGIDFAAGGKVEEQPLYAAPIAQPSRPDDQPEYTDSEFGFLVDTLNGLTEQETAASASVAGLSGAQPEPDDLITVAHVECEGGAGTLTVDFDQMGTLGVLLGEEEETYTVRIAPMTRADFEALGEFDGF
jgi:hypothetical protein